MARINPSPLSVANNGETAEDPDSGMAWAAIFGGALTAIAVTLILSPLGTALGFAWVSPWHPNSEVGKAMTATAAIWLLVVQWISSGLGGYLTGRLRTRWAGAHTHEVFFRDTVHGFLAWALATVLGAAVIVGMLSHMSGGMGHGMRGQEAAGPQFEAYYTDMLFRSRDTNATVSEQDRGEAARILTHEVAKGNIADNDRAYLAQLVAARAEISTMEAQQRITDALNDQKTAADTLRKAAAEASIFLCLALLVGAFIASVAGALGGRHRDLHYETGSLRVTP